MTRAATHRLDESLLAPMAPFDRMERTQIREVLDQATPRRLEEGATVFHEGETAESFFLLLDGTIRVTHVTPTGENVAVLHIPAGQLFGFAPAIGRTHYPGTAEAASECLVLAWPVRLWDTFAAINGFAAETHATVGRRLAEMNDRIVEMATQAVEQRVASAVARLANQTGRRTNDGIEIGFPITRQDLSELTGTTLYTVSRLLSAWERDGIVLSTRKRVVVTDPHRLVELVEGRPGTK
ncbi:MAG: Crp/Fnr family transcriptional regulator [Jannaschia sp.]